MRRAAVALAFVVFALSPAAAFASSWRAVTPTTLGYESVPATSFARVNILSRVLGSSFDLTATATLRAQGVETGSDGFASFAFGGATSPDDIETVRTFAQGQSFAFAYSYSHFRDPALGISNSGQMATLYWRGVSTASEPLTSRQKSVINELGTSGCWKYVTPYSAAVTTVTADVYGFKAAENRVRVLALVVGEWNAGAGAWRVRSQLVASDGFVSGVETDEATATPTGGEWYCSVAPALLPNGWLFDRYTLPDGRQGVKIRAEQGNVLSNLECYQAAETTDAAAVAEVADLTLGVSSLDLVPAYHASGAALPDEVSEETATSIGKWQQWFNDRVDALTDALSGLSDLLWFVAPVKEWFGLE